MIKSVGGVRVPQIDFSTVLAVFLAIGAIYVVGMILVLPIKMIIKLIINGVIGAILLFIINIFSSIIGITIAINPVTAIVAGFLGIPGVILLLVLQFLMR